MSDRNRLALLVGAVGLMLGWLWGFYVGVKDGLDIANATEGCCVAAPLPPFE